MIPGRIAGATNDLAKPKNWDDSKGHCSTLPIRRVEFDGVPAMISAWQPTPDELQRLLAGESVHLIIWGVAHPPVAITVGDIQ